MRRSKVPSKRILACGISILLAGTLSACSTLQSLVPTIAPFPSVTATATPSQSPTESPTPTPTPRAVVAPDRPSYPVPDVTPKGFAPAPSGVDMAGYLEQELKWKECGKAECATVLAPLDYDDPTSQAITLALKRIKATQEPKIGSLFINPGGPGASGIEYVDTFHRKGLERFDIISWDPRGVGASTPVKCFSGKQTDKLTAMDVAPNTEAGRQELIAA
ncbi:MAG: hypothetical protein FWG47_02795, partial [Propionibacteriaceae bacterium]|nr:hypothetical protein [Propionibacteriaceae bacterium]